MVARLLVLSDRLFLSFLRASLEDREDDREESGLGCSCLGGAKRDRFLVQSQWTCHFLVWIYVPFRRLLDLVQLGLAQLAIVFFWQVCLVMKTHAAAVLPHETLVALYKEIARIFCKDC